MFKRVSFKGQGLNKAFKNIVWLFFDKILRITFGVFVVILLARYLGPAKFGLFNYIVALVALFNAFSALGLNAIVTRELVLRADKDKILATSFVTRLIGAAVAYVSLLACVWLLRSDEALAKPLVLIMGLTLFFHSSEVIKFWFESQVSSKYVVIIENSAFVLFSIIKLVLIYLKVPLVTFAYVVSAEAFVVFLGLFWVFLYKGSSIKRWRFDLNEARFLLLESWPLIISSAAWVVYTRIDQVMIGQILGDRDVGLYSAASRLSEVASFLPAVITFSVVPIVLKIKEKDY